MLAALAGCLVIYFVYKLCYRPDFGLPVRRRLWARRLHVRRDQFADVPVWWSDFRVQRAIRGHLKQGLREIVTRPIVSGTELTGHSPEMSARGMPGIEWRQARAEWPQARGWAEASRVAIPPRNLKQESSPAAR